MAPCDQKGLAGTVLMPAQFTVWHSEYTDHYLRKAAENNSSENPFQLNMLLWTEQYESPKEVKMDPLDCSRCSQAAFHALKMVLEAKVLGPGSFVNILQGATEAYLDFVDRLQEAIRKQVESQEAAKTVSLQWAYENANCDCTAVLNPLKLTTTDISQFIKACQDVGTEQHPATLPAAAIKGEIKCFHCGRPGRSHQECRNKLQKNPDPPGKDCPRCGKG